MRVSVLSFLFFGCKCNRRSRAEQDSILREMSTCVADPKSPIASTPQQRRKAAAYPSEWMASSRTVAPRQRCILPSAGRTSPFLRGHCLPLPCFCCFQTAMRVVNAATPSMATLSPMKHREVARARRVGDKGAVG
jgi:hypothetical protein